MPLASLAHYVGGESPAEGLYTAAKWGVVLALVCAVRAWSKGYVCREERELAGRTYILAGGFSGTGLAVFQSLAERGAQVIALHPGEPTPKVLQLVLLLRSTTANERLYADECDLASVASVREFVRRWRKDARAGMVGDLEARLDGVLLLDEDGDALPFGAAQRWAEGAGAEAEAEAEQLSVMRMRRLTGRHALVQLLLPVLLQSAGTSTTPLRVVSTVSPFYAAAVAQGGFCPEDVDYTAGGTFPRFAPWEAEGRTALAHVLLTRELHARLSSLPQPSSSSSSSPAGVAPAAVPILPLLVCPGLTRSSLRHLVAPTWRRPARMVAYALLAPWAWLCAKSAQEAAQGVLGALLGEVERPVGAGAVGAGTNSKGREREESGGARRMRVRGGALYREGREVRILGLDALPPSVSAALWDSESKIVERLLAAAAEAEKRKENQKDEGKASQGADRDGECPEARKDV